MKTLRTPDERFENLPGYPFAPHYTEVPDGEGGRLRVHHVDEGPAEGELILCLHGQPTWSYLYRKMIPVFVEAGFRVIAPDFVGFGRSDKPSAIDDYTYARHVQWMSAWLRSLDLRGINLFCQDWGGLIGLRLVAAYPERFSRVVAANTGLPDGGGVAADAAPAMHALYESLPVVSAAEVGARFRDREGPPGFLFWIKYCAESPDFSIGDIMQMAGGAPLSDAERAAYEAPFPDARFVAGARRFPGLVPIFPDDPEIPASRAAWDRLAAFARPFLTAFSDGDPVTAGLERVFQQRVAGAKGIEHVTIRGAGHFLQEEQGEVVARVMIDFIRANPVA